MFRSFLQHYFGFNKQQRNGLFVLLLISFFLLLTRIVYPYFIQPSHIVVLDLPLVARPPGTTQQPKWNTKTKFSNNERRLFRFDPNTATKEQLVTLGFSEKQALSFLKFRSKGFVFRKKEDLKKVFVVSDYLYNRLENYVVIEGLKTQASFPSPVAQLAHTAIATATVPSKKINPVTVITELNSADSIALVALPGIGPVIARRILKYRNLLGGFVSTEQLREVFGISEELFGKLQPLTQVRSDGIKKININTNDFKTLSRHPYLGFDLTKRIFQERRKGTLDAGALETLMADETAFRKLMPYLTFGE